MRFLAKLRLIFGGEIAIDAESEEQAREMLLHLGMLSRSKPPEWTLDKVTASAAELLEIKVVA